MTTCTLELDPISLTLDLSVGHIAELKIRDGQRVLTPLHRAPWVDVPDTVFPESTPPNVRRLSGGFFCAPFGRNDMEDAPSHGWPANSAWDHCENVTRDDRLTGIFRLQKLVMGAIVEKRITLIAGHPFVYQEHCISGGTGSVSAAHHVMVHMAEGGDLVVSAKTGARTPPDALESDPARGRSRLAYSAETKELTAFPLADGGTADLTSYPVAARHEDFVTLAEAPGQALGWSVVSRKAEQDRVIVLKRSDILPVTMLWMSNGGRDYAPWSGRHTGVLGIEDARASPLGHADSCRDNALTRAGVATAFELNVGSTIGIRQIIGACTAETGDSKVEGLWEEKEGKLAVRLQDGTVCRLSYDPAFLAGSP